MKRILAALALAALLAGCASGSRNVAYAPKDGQAVQTITIVLPPEPKKYAVVNMGHPGLVFGVIGGMFVAAGQDAKEARFYEAMKFQKFSVKAALGKGLEKRLNAAGYAARVVDGVWVEKDGRQVLQLDKVAADTDAILVVVPMSAGFLSEGPASDYVPATTVAARLLGKDRKTDLYRGYHAAGWAPRAEGWRYTPAQAAFSDFDALMERPAATAAALGQTLDAVSDSIVQDLRKEAQRP